MLLPVFVGTVVDYLDRANLAVAAQAASEAREFRSATRHAEPRNAEREPFTACAATRFARPR
jgi:hypothetical protein